jgi:5'-methylthioadenosine phosphorylase
MPRVAIIGGSGFYSLFENPEQREVETPFGNVILEVGKVRDVEVAFIARHGRRHEIPPSKVNYKANLYALKQIGVERVVATNAVGAINPSIEPGTFVVPHDFIDFTKNRDSTFYDGKTEIMVDGRILRGVVHVSMTPDPYCPEIRSAILQSLSEAGVKFVDRGVYVVTEGNRFETPAEIKAFSFLGGDIVGMTGVPEAVLARELAMCYATLCLVTNYAAGVQGSRKLTHDEVADIYERNLKNLRDVVARAVELIPLSRSCSCGKALEGAIASK